jgi:CubicO group peptidase (beta-lactamase class C family)
MGQHQVSGWCDPAFLAVREAFAANFTDRGELGAAVSVIVGGRLVAELSGGGRDAAGTQAWTAGTLVNVFSVGKGVLAACLARLVGRGQLDPEARVARYWPEFAARGKDAVTVRELLSHQAGLPALHARLAPGSALDWQFMTAALAAEEPWWPPGTGHGYHVNTFGFLAGELLRRTTGLLPGEYLRREIAGPLGADVFIGLTAAQFPRVAEFHWPDAAPAGIVPGGAAARGPAGARVRESPVPDTVRSRGGDLSEPPAGTEEMALHAYFNPPDLSGAGVVNTAAWRRAQIPSANAHATATGIARLYAPLAAGGGDVVDPGALRTATAEQVYGDDLVLQRPSRFGLGFQLTHPEREFGPGPACFGHFGAGGSVGFCDPDTGLAFGYVTNQMGPRWRNPRNRALIDACYSCL